MKRFYTNATVKKQNDYYIVLLDNRPIKTPNKQILTVPTLDMATAVCDEWNRIPTNGEVNPHHMHIMCLVSTAIDKVIPNIHAIQKSAVEYANTDVLCYRTGTFGHLRKKQDDTWDTWIAYANDTLHMPLQVTTGIMPISQSKKAIQSAYNIVKNMHAYQLTAFADMVAILGSFVMGCALIYQDTDTHTAFNICYLDENHQIAEWGSDSQSREILSKKQQHLQRVYTFYHIC